MKKKNLFGVSTCALLFCILIASIAIFSACNINDNTYTDDNNNADQTQDTNNSKETIIELTLNNYEEYFVLQEEIISYEQNDYQSPYGNFQMTKVVQITNLSIIQLQENLKFNKVVLTIDNDTWHGGYYTTGKLAYDWEGNGGKLTLSYNGSSSITLRATYDGYLDELSRCPMKYKVAKIEGTITIVN